MQLLLHWAQLWAVNSACIQAEWQPCACSIQLLSLHPRVGVLLCSQECLNDPLTSMALHGYAVACCMPCSCGIVPSWPTSMGGSVSAGGANSSNGQSEQQQQCSTGASSPGPASRNSSSSDLAAAAAAAGSGSEPSAAPAVPRKAGLISSTAAAALRAFKRHQQGPQHLLADFSPHLWCSCKPLVRPDSSLIAAVTASLDKEQQGTAAASYRGTPTAAGAANRQLRRHFAELTAAFLAPFDRYFELGPNGTVSVVGHLYVKFVRVVCAA